MRIAPVRRWGLSVAERKRSSSRKAGSRSNRQSLKSPPTRQGTSVGRSGELARPGQDAHLLRSLARGEAQVQVEHLETPAPSSRSRDQHPRVLAPAPLAEADGEVDVPLAQDRVPAQGGVPVASLAQGHVVPDGHVGIAEGLGQLAARGSARATGGRPRPPPARARGRRRRPRGSGSPARAGSADRRRSPDGCCS